MVTFGNFVTQDNNVYQSPSKNPNTPIPASQAGRDGHSQKPLTGQNLGGSAAGAPGHTENLLLDNCHRRSAHAWRNTQRRIKCVTPSIISPFMCTHKQA